MKTVKKRVKRTLQTVGIVGHRSKIVVSVECRYRLGNWWGPPEERPEGAGWPRGSRIFDPGFLARYVVAFLRCFLMYSRNLPARKLFKASHFKVQRS